MTMQPWKGGMLLYAYKDLHCCRTFVIKIFYSFLQTFYLFVVVGVFEAVQ